MNMAQSLKTNLDAKTDLYLNRDRRASSKRGDVDTARQLMRVMESKGIYKFLHTQLALVEGMIEGGTPWAQVERELLSFIAANESRRRLGDMQLASVVLALVRAGDLEGARRALKVLPVECVYE